MDRASVPAAAESGPRPDVPVLRKPHGATVFLIGRDQSTDPQPAWAFLKGRSLVWFRSDFRTAHEPWDSRPRALAQSPEPEFNKRQCLKRIRRQPSSNLGVTKASHENRQDRVLRQQGGQTLGRGIGGQKKSSLIVGKELSASHGVVSWQPAAAPYSGG
jgi:hypothetical protein